MPGIPQRKMAIIQYELDRCEICKSCWTKIGQMVKATYIIAMGVLGTMEIRIYGYCTIHGNVIKKAFNDRSLKIDLSSSYYVDEILIRDKHENPDLQIY